jgi:hypothetical protein
MLYVFILICEIKYIGLCSVCKSNVGRCLSIQIYCLLFIGDLCLNVGGTVREVSSSVYHLQCLSCSLTILQTSGLGLCVSVYLLSIQYVTDIVVSL